MKNLFLILAFLAVSSFAVASNGTPAEEDKERAKIEECEKPQKRVSCSRELNGITYTAKAGGLFTSEARANEKCEEKLDRIIAHQDGGPGEIKLID